MQMDWMDFFILSKKALVINIQLHSYCNFPPCRWREEFQDCEAA